MSLCVKLEIPNTEYWIRYNALSPEDYQAIMDDVEPMGLYRSFLVPVRTNKIKGFVLDFFLPNYKFFCSVDGKIHKIFAVLGALTLSVLTLPIRLVTSLPRYLYNRTRSAPPCCRWLQDDLKKQGLSLSFQNAFKKADYVKRTVLSNSTSLPNITLNQPACLHFIELPLRHG